MCAGAAPGSALPIAAGRSPPAAGAELAAAGSTAVAQNEELVLRAVAAREQQDEREQPAGNDVDERHEHRQPPRTGGADATRPLANPSLCTPRVDGLVVIGEHADGRDVLAEGLHDRELRSVSVLEFVDQQVAEPGPVGLGNLAVLLEQVGCIDDALCGS